ncbi:hypothetical protein B0I35DRAFT_362464 [Stachybotrys elegans]|uniref:Protein EFR3 n=1 Tax=Stachybotrys elegans TaxID=80388 RepID=A0A8K0SE42_9HYPO|nr:hypothetical protein B0I35DRAFT_362464 [Stachybotrys elegans]
MNAIQQKCRPKHQVLVLKCYPRTNKAAVDVKPNSSELSYLLFYATSRKSKIQKIGAFLEKKTASDVWRMRIGNVQVTLGILTALVEKLSKDFALIAPSVLRILDIILRSKDITMIESSLPTFEAFCDHHDPTTLFADQDYLHQYDNIIRSYAVLASTQQTPERGSVSKPMEMRWRSAGLAAIRAIATSDALSSLNARQVNVIMPMILENLCAGNDEYLDLILKRINNEAKADADKGLRRRTSVTTVNTAETTNEPPNPVALLGTALDVDKLVEEDIAVLAMNCLKSIFVVPNRPQIQAATGALIKFIFERVNQGDAVVQVDQETMADQGWAVKIFSCVTRWAPVQDRYVILVSTLDTMITLPIKDETMEQHFVLTDMVDSLLRSDINLIGLSVMDVLLGLLRQMKKLITLPSSGSRSGSLNEDGAVQEKEKDGAAFVEHSDLLTRLEQCVGDLATHVYYADQISDMIAALIARLRPTRPSSTSSSPHGEKTDNPDAAPNTSIADLTDNPSQVETYFSYNVGRLTALRVIKSILLVANPQSKMAGNLGLSRSRVPIHVWEGTQWLLRDPDPSVRRAYADALITWMERETTRNDILAKDDHLLSRTTVRGTRDTPAANARRAVSNASNRERQPRARRCQFIPLLHVAIYDNALQYVEHDTDMVMLHTLLIKLMYNLGVNAVRYGIPMIYRLQEDVQELESPVHKVRIAALCHGYFWGLTEMFDFETTVVGRAIQNEVIRRRSKGFWVEGVNVPPLSMDGLAKLRPSTGEKEWDVRALESEELLPFDERSSLVGCIDTSYQEMAQSPPGSPAASPGRMIASPILNNPTLDAPFPEASELQLPSAFREQMLADWSREAAVAALAAEGKTDSLSGSKNGTLAPHGNRLTVHSIGVNGGSPAPGSPHASQHNLRPHSFVHGERERLGTSGQYRKSSLRSGISPSASAPGNHRGNVASVEQLKMILTGSTAAPPAGTAELAEDESGESMVSYEYAPSELSFLPSGRRASAAASEIPRRSLSGSRRGPLTSNPPSEAGPVLEDGEEEEENVPPVPPLPNLQSFSGKPSVVHAADISVQDHALKPAKRNLQSRGGQSTKARSIRSRDDGHGVDLQELLRGIDSRSGEGSLGNLTKPPY